MPLHDVVIVGVPLIAILAGVLFNRSDLHGEISGLRSEMNARFNKVEDHLGRIDADLRQFYHLTGKLEARMDAIEKRP
jgi:hypothetical protein